MHLVVDSQGFIRKLNGMPSYQGIGYERASCVKIILLMVFNSNNGGFLGTLHHMKP